MYARATQPAAQSGRLCSVIPPCTCHTPVGLGLDYGFIGHHQCRALPLERPSSLVPEVRLPDHPFPPSLASSPCPTVASCVFHGPTPAPHPRWTPSCLTPVGLGFPHPLLTSFPCRLGRSFPSPPNWPGTGTLVHVSAVVSGNEWWVCGCVCSGPCAHGCMWMH